MTYSLFHGPAFTTIVGIADALDLDIVIQPRRNWKKITKNSPRNGRRK
jgi:hypothetical protein